MALCEGYPLDTPAFYCPLLFYCALFIKLIGVLVLQCFVNLCFVSLCEVRILRTRLFRRLIVFVYTLFLLIKLCIYFNILSFVFYVYLETVNISTV